MFEEYSIDKMPGHWLLARMGKRVLRPGGRELTLKMLDELDIGMKDTVVEFAPGMGSTAKLVMEKKPGRYFGVDQNEEAIEHLSGLCSNNGYKFIKADITDSGLRDNFATVVLGEAVLTMQTDERKERIIKEAHRILERGGRYSIHEICLEPDNLGEQAKDRIRKELSGEIRVNARPLTAEEWKRMFAKAGFRVEIILMRPMHLLEPSRLVRDEGIAGVGRIIYNALTTRGAMKRVSGMRKVFNKYEKYMRAINIIGIKE